MEGTHHLSRRYRWISHNGSRYSWLFLLLAGIALFRIIGAFPQETRTVYPGTALSANEKVTLSAELAALPDALDARLSILTLRLVELRRKDGLRVSATGEIVLFIPVDQVPEYAARGTKVELPARYDADGKTFRSSGELVFSPKENRPAEIFAQMRFQAQSWVQQRFSPLYWEAQQLSSSLIIGRPVHRDDRLFDSCRRSGTAHVMALSGLHVGILLQLLNILLRSAAGKTWSRIVTMVLLAGYLWFAGIRESLLRSVGMYWFYALSDLCGRPITGIKLLFLTALTHGVLFPGSVFTLSFLLSYGSLTGIVCLFHLIYDSFPWVIPPLFRAAAGLSISAAFGSWPVLLAFGLDIYPVGLIISIPAVAGVTLFMWLGLIYLALPWFPGIAQMLRMVSIGLSFLWDAGSELSKLQAFSPFLWIGVLIALLTLLGTLQYRGFRRIHGNTIGCTLPTALQLSNDDQEADGRSGTETLKAVWTELPD